MRAGGRRPRPDDLPAAVKYQTVDLAGDDDLSPLLSEVTHVFHLAGASSSQSSEDEMYRGNVVATERLVDAASRSETLERLLYMSSTSVYGEEVQLPSPVLEEIEPQPSRAYGKAKWAAEQVLWEADAAGAPVIIMRPVSVYGPGNVKLLASAILDAAIERFAGSRVLPVPATPVEQRLVHIDDVVRATLHLAVHPWSVGGAYNVVFPSYPTSHEVAGVIAGELGMDVELQRRPRLRARPRGEGNDPRRDAGGRHGPRHPAHQGAVPIHAQGQSEQPPEHRRIALHRIPIRRHRSRNRDSSDDWVVPGAPLDRLSQPG